MLLSNKKQYKVELCQIMLYNINITDILEVLLCIIQINLLPRKTTIC